MNEDVARVIETPPHEVVETWYLEGFDATDYRGVRYRIFRVTRDETGVVTAIGSKLDARGNPKTHATYTCHFTDPAEMK